MKDKIIIKRLMRGKISETEISMDGLLSIEFCIDDDKYQVRIEEGTFRDGLIGCLSVVAISNPARPLAVTPISGNAVIIRLLKDLEDYERYEQALELAAGALYSSREYMAAYNLKITLDQFTKKVIAAWMKGEQI